VNWEGFGKKQFYPDVYLKRPRNTTIIRGYQPVWYDDVIDKTHVITSRYKLKVQRKYKK
jgi:hypothetical protein